MSSPAVSDGVVYVGSDNDVFYALNASNGVPMWNFTATAGFGSSAAVSGGLVYVSSWNGEIYALNATNGAKLWNYTAGGGFESSPTVVDGVLYISSDDGNVYAFGASTLVTSPSPSVSEFSDQLLGTMLVISMFMVLSAVIVAKKRIT